MNVKLVRVSQHKPFTADHYVIVTWRIVDQVDACFKAVWSTNENHVITPCISCHEACEVGIPKWNSIIKMDEAETQGITMLLKKQQFLFILLSHEAQTQSGAYYGQ